MSEKEKTRISAKSFDRLLAEIKNKHPFVVDIFYNAHTGTWDMNTEIDGVNEFDTFENAFKRVKYLAKEVEAIMLGLKKASIERRKSSYEGLHREFECYESFHSILYDEKECSWKVWIKTPESNLYSLLFETIQGAHEYFANIEKQ